MNNCNNVSDNPSSFARGQRVAVQWENEGEALGTISHVSFWGNIVSFSVTYDDARFEARANMWGGRYRELKVNDACHWSATFRMV